MREFDVLVNAPANVTAVNAASPYYAGTIAFFGARMNMTAESSDATFAVPLPHRSESFPALGAGASVPLTIRVVPSSGRGAAPPIRGVTVKAR
jgi:tyrosinase